MQASFGSSLSIFVFTKSNRNCWWCQSKFFNNEQLGCNNMNCEWRSAESNKCCLCAMHCTPPLHDAIHLCASSLFIDALHSTFKLHDVKHCRCTSMFMRTCCLHILMLTQSKDIFRLPQDYRPKPPPKPKEAKRNNGRKARENAQRA